MASVEDQNIDIINAAILEALFKPEITELEHMIIQKWDTSQYMTKEEILRFFNTLDLRLIKVK